jgi:hypothetical protein
MKLIGILILIVALLFPQLSNAQKRNRILSRSNAQLNAAAEKSWPSFFADFRVAVKKRNRAALRKMLAPNLLFSLGHHQSDHLDEAFKFWDANNGRGWKAFNRILAQGTEPQARWWHNGESPKGPSRVAPAIANHRVNILRGRIDWYAIFEFREDGRWYCTIFQECCD